MANFVKVANTRAVGPAHRVDGYAAYAPKASSARRTDLSWQALTEVATANPEGFTVQQYLDHQRTVNPDNIGDALPCFRYWCGSAKVSILDPAAPAVAEPTPEAPEA